jgi:hypothetical protein
MRGENAIDRTEFKVELGIKKATERYPSNTSSIRKGQYRQRCYEKRFFIGPAVIYGKGVAA